jgi:hypothetical protein
MLSDIVAEYTSQIGGFLNAESVARMKQELLFQGH